MTTTADAAGPATIAPPPPHPGRAPRGLFGLPSLANRLAALFFAITALALATVIFIFLPQLRGKLDDQRLHDLATHASATAPQIGRVIGQSVTGPEVDQLVRSVADSTGARVTLVGLQQSSQPSPPRFYVISDSSGGAATSAPRYDLVARAAQARAGAAPLATRRGEAGVVAVTLYYGGHPDWVLLFTRRFDDVAAVVALVRDRLLVASGVALLVALFGGYLVARALARRVARIDRAARALAAGRHGPPLRVDSRDELGRLTQTFNEMQQQLERVERARRDFIANASHELRTPIFSLAGFVELLQDEQLDGETREEFLQTMGEQVARLQKLAVDLLDLSRLDAGSIELRREQVDLGELAGAVAAEFRPALAAHSTEIELDGRPVAAICDRERVAQIMRILLDNALRHTPDGTPVKVSTERHNGTAEFTVADRGPGVEAAARSQLFERFYTGDAARGSGLGLAIARQLAEAMDGTITLLSRPGRTIFTLTLPAPADRS